MSRREFLKLAAAAPLAALAAPVGAEAASPLRALFHQWQEIKRVYNALPPDCDAETEDRLFYRMVDLEHRAADFDPQTMEDLVFKIIFADDNGTMNLNIHQEALVARAYAMARVSQVDRLSLQG